MPWEQAHQSAHRRLKVQHVSAQHLVDLESRALRAEYKHLQVKTSVQLHMLRSQCLIQERQLQELRMQLAEVHSAVSQIRSNFMHNARVHAIINPLVLSPRSSTVEETTARASILPASGSPTVLPPGWQSGVLESPTLSSPAAMRGQTHSMADDVDVLVDPWTLCPLVKAAPH